MEAVEVRLQATVSASEFDEHYQMAFVYCMDAQRNYCFSLSRFPDEECIEVMVRDQLVCKVDDVSVTLEGQTMTVALDSTVAARLDGESGYVIELNAAEEELPGIRAALRKIFEGKSGLRVQAN
ncbi:transcriptional repressor [Ralstonia solanacearum]|uniref:transcriptional repressor n=1 Tax=Ralstonia solanacearum TaxID=305 RepID=UPI0018D0A014|nr:transcriptional repressor [Ralstonia solanacearum]